MSSKHLWLLNRDCFDRLIEAFTTEPPPRPITVKEEALLNSAISFAHAPPSKLYWLGVTSRGFMGEDNYGALRSLYNTLPPVKSKPKLRIVTPTIVTNPKKLKDFLFSVAAGTFLLKQEAEWLMESFRWNKTPQGETYWGDIHQGEQPILLKDIAYLVSLTGGKISEPAKFYDIDDDEPPIHSTRDAIETDEGKTNRLIALVAVGKKLSDKACDLLDAAFEWRSSPQGYEHWQNMYLGRSKPAKADLDYLKSLVVPYNPAKLEYVS